MLQWLIDRAKRTPYFHLEGYMNRWWLVPYNVIITRQVEPNHKPFTDGTGMVSPWRRPITWLIQKMGFAIRVHEILRSDTNRDPRNHPWPYLTIVLKGGYFETRYTADGEEIDQKWHGLGSILYRPANSWHKLWLREGRTVTTLFVTGKKCQRWGFMTAEGFVPYDKYHGRNA
jgi:hypothetical protein